MIVQHVSMLSLYEKYSELVKGHNVSPIEKTGGIYGFSVKKEFAGQAIEEIHTFSNGSADELRRLQDDQEQKTKDLLTDLKKLDELQRVAVVVELLDGLSKLGQIYCKYHVSEKI